MSHVGAFKPNSETDPVPLLLTRGLIVCRGVGGFLMKSTIALESGGDALRRAGLGIAVVCHEDSIGKALDEAGDSKEITIITLTQAENILHSWLEEHVPMKLDVTKEMSHEVAQEIYGLFKNVGAEDLFKEGRNMVAKMDNVSLVRKLMKFRDLPPDVKDFICNAHP